MLHAFLIWALVGSGAVTLTPLQLYPCTHWIGNWLPGDREHCLTGSVEWGRVAFEIPNAEADSPPETSYNLNIPKTVYYSVQHNTFLNTMEKINIPALTGNFVRPAT
jgi:hypothetical protein